MLTFIIIVAIIGFAIYFFMKNKKVKNKVKMNGWLFDFDNQCFFEPYKMTQKQGHLFSEVAEVQVVEQKHGETKKHTITRGLVDNAIAGPLRAIIGVAGKGKQVNMIDYCGLNIMLKDGSFKTFDVIKSPTKINTSTQVLLKEMNRVYMTLSAIANNKLENND